MSLMPFGYGGALTPFGLYNDPWVSPIETVLPEFQFPGFRSLTPAMRRMEHELGRLISSVKEDDKSFQMCVDVGQFQPNEITVKTTDDNIIVHAKHEERNDQHGYVTREFRRRMSIPKGVNPESVTSTLSPGGVLTILAPKMAVEGSNERVIPITMAPSAGSSNIPKAIN